MRISFPCRFFREEIFSPGSYLANFWASPNPAPVTMATRLLNWRLFSGIGQAKILSVQL
jgi:hypothetical protein